MRFELTKDFLEVLRLKIAEQDLQWIRENVLELHYAEIAEILDKLNNEEAKLVYFLVDEDLQADILMELDEEVRDRFLASLSTKEFADQLENLDSDDAADILGDLPNEKIQEVISQMEDDEAAEDIVDLLNYDEDTAGGLMQKEFFQAQIDWPVNYALEELRKQAEDVEKVYNIFVVDESDKLLGVLSLKRILFAGANTKIGDLYQAKNIISVKTSDSVEIVSDVMEKYDLVSVPVVDYQNKLVGRITLDDVVDFIKEGADKDFQLATGITEPMESNASIWRISKARLPWLIIGMFGGVLGANVISRFEGSITQIPARIVPSECANLMAFTFRTSSPDLNIKPKVYLQSKIMGAWLTVKIADNKRMTKTATMIVLELKIIASQTSKHTKYLQNANSPFLIDTICCFILFLEKTSPLLADNPYNSQILC